MAAQSALCHPPPPAETQSLCLGEREWGIHFWTLEEKEGEGRKWKSLGWVCSGDSILSQVGVELGGKGLRCLQESPPPRQDPEAQKSP